MLSREDPWSEIETLRSSEPVLASTLTRVSLLYPESRAVFLALALLSDASMIWNTGAGF